PGRSHNSSPPAVSNVGCAALAIRIRLAFPRRKSNPPPRTSKPAALYAAKGLRLPVPCAARPTLAEAPAASYQRRIAREHCCKSHSQLLRGGLASSPRGPAL